MARTALVASAALVALSAIGAAPAHAAASFTIHTDRGFIKRIGAFRTNGGFEAGLLRGAIRVWGAPSRRTSIYSDNDCRIEWQALRLSAMFVNFGGGGTACEADYGRLQTATIKSRRFRTTRGIRVGSRSVAIPRRHPSAEFRGGAWWITSVYLPYGDGSEQATIKAIVANGRVTALKLWVGAGGE